MKEVILEGTRSVPAPRVSVAERMRVLLNRALPEECKIETAQDAWYVAAIGAACVMMVFPPAVLALAWCVVRAKKAGKGGER